jgi:hypothetical protein
MNTDVLNEAYDRLHRTGPEFGGENWLANHGPMAAEVLARRGHADRLPGWVDAYVRRLDDLPRPGDEITDRTWREALGDPRRVGDWTAYFVRQVGERPWREVLAHWWPRLLPGILAGATHGVIRVGHAARTLLAGNDGPHAVTELAHGLAYWAARSQVLSGVPAPAGRLAPAQALDLVPRIPDQQGTVAARVGQLDGLAGFATSVAALRAPAAPSDVPDLLADLVTAATLQYLPYGHGQRVLLIHVATAPNAVRHTLPALPQDLWLPSLAAAWAASAAITAGYAPRQATSARDLPPAPADADPVAELLGRAAAHGDEHVIKFSDTAAEVFQHTGNPDALAAAVHAARLIDGADR